MLFKAISSSFALSIFLFPKKFNFSSKEFTSFILFSIICLGLLPFNPLCNKSTSFFAFKNFLSIALCKNSFLFNKSFIISFNDGDTNSPAADGVGALISLTKSLIVKSTSWPTADTVGILLLNISYAKSLLLKAQSSSIDPPPLPKMITSTDFSLLKYLIPSIIESAAFSP